MVYNCINTIRSYIFTTTCILCGARGDGNLDLCDPCRRSLPSNVHSCFRCALPLPSGSSANVCGKCLKSRPRFHRCIAPLVYQPPVDHLISGLKFQRHLPNGRLLAGLLLQQLLRLPADLPDLIIPVPLHPSRQQQRGFNQALELARPIGRRLGIPLDYRTCVRLRNTGPQTGLQKVHRQQNLRGAFALARPLGMVRHLALVDDVITTGSTVNELASLLCQAGAVRVQVWAVARTL